MPSWFRRPFYHLSATAVWWLHIAWILILVAGIPALAWDPRYGVIELGLIAITFVAQLVWRGCPLTLLEEGLRTKHDPAYRKRTAFIAPLLQRFGIRKPLHITPLHLGLLAIAVLAISSILRSRAG